jgi:hypothetical protein
VSDIVQNAAVRTAKVSRMLQDVSVLAAEFQPRLELAMGRTVAALLVREKVTFKVKVVYTSKILNTV